MAIQNRRGPYSGFLAINMLPGEFAFITKDDPNTADGKAVYACFVAGDVKRMATYEDMVENIGNASSEVIRNEMEAATGEAVKACEDAAANASAAAEEASNAAEEASNAVEEMEKAAAEDIGQIKSTVLQVNQTVDTWSQFLSEIVQVEIDTDYVWAPVTGDDNNWYKMPLDASGGEAASVKLEVNPGESYKITVGINDTYYQEMGCPIIGAAYNVPGSDTYQKVQEGYAPLEEGGNEYLITVPEGCNCLLINSFGDDAENILVTKMNISNIKGGAYLLWSGVMQDMTSSNLSESFEVPEKCFFDGGKQLILLINGYCPEDGPEKNAFQALTVGLCLGTSDDFGGVAAPFGNGQTVRYLYAPEAYTYTTPHVIDMYLEVSKVTDNRYAVCVVQNRSDTFFVTSISALAMTEL